MMKRTKTMVAAGGVALVLAGTGAGIAVAQTAIISTPAPAPPSPTAKAHTQGAKHGDHLGKALLGKVEHGEFTTHTKTGDKVMDVQRGTVTAIAPDSITVMSPDNVSTTYTTNLSTKVHKDKKPASAGDVAKNDRVMLTAVKGGGTTTAQRIGDAGPPK